MFAIPITIPILTSESVRFLASSVQIDDIVAVKSLLDSYTNIGVESGYHLMLPQAELLLEDGRKLPISEPVEFIHQYMETYRAIESFYTTKPVVNEKREGNVIPLFQGSSCDTSEESIPA